MGREYRVYLLCDADDRWRIVKAAKHPLGQLIGAVGTAEELEAMIQAKGVMAYKLVKTKPIGSGTSSPASVVVR